MDHDITYAINENGKFVSIDDIKVRGLACNCRCANCKELLKARLGKVRKPHFAHHNSNKKVGNKTCYENTLHKLAISVIEEEKCVMLPSLDCIDAQKVSFEHIEVEERNDSPDLQPDLVGVTSDEKRIAIEIKYTHEVDERKLDKILKKGITCVEIDISNIPMDKEKLREFLCESVDDREWLNNPEYEHLIIDHYEHEYNEEHDSRIHISISDKSLEEPIPSDDGFDITSFEPYKRNKYYVIEVIGNQLDVKFPKIEKPQPTSDSDNDEDSNNSLNLKLISDYHRRLRRHQCFDKIINSKVVEYWCNGDRVIVRHKYLLEGKEMFRLSVVTAINGKLHFDQTIREFSDESEAKNAELNLIFGKK